MNRVFAALLYKPAKNAGFLTKERGKKMNNKTNNRYQVRAVYDWVELFEADRELEGFGLWDKVLEKVGFTHAASGVWEFGEQWLLIVADTETKEVVWWICEPGDEGGSEVFAILHNVYLEVEKNGLAGL